MRLTVHLSLAALADVAGIICMERYEINKTPGADTAAVVLLAFALISLAAAGLLLYRTVLKPR